MVNTSGRRFIRLRVQRVLNSSEWFFFITKARRKGAMNKMVRSPQTALPAQWLPVSSTEKRRIMGRTSENIMVMVAAERMP